MYSSKNGKNQWSVWVIMIVNRLELWISGWKMQCIIIIIIIIIIITIIIIIVNIN